MENVRKHLQENHDKADKAYWDYFEKLEAKKIELSQVEHDVKWLTTDMEQADIKRKHFHKLLNELDEHEKPTKS